MPAPRPATAEAPLEVRDPDTGRLWSIPRRETRSVRAQIRERWFVNAAADPALFAALVPARFLAPQLVNGALLLSLCGMVMDRAAPDWAPLEWGPASRNAALRVACLDTRTGEPCVWVGERHTTSCLGPVLRLMGFPPLASGLAWDEDAFRIAAADGGFACRKLPVAPAAPALFENGAALGAFLAQGVRGYGPGLEPGQVAAVDLVKEAYGPFEAQTMAAQLRTPVGDFRADGVYVSRGGLYRWDLMGTFDLDGRRMA